MRTKEQLRQLLRKSLQGGDPLFWLDAASETSSPVRLDAQERGKIESDEFDTDTILLVKPLGGESEIEVLPGELYSTSLRHIAIGVPIEFDDSKTDVLLDIEQFISEGDMQSAFNLVFDHYYDGYDWCRIDDFFQRLNDDAIDTENFYWYNCQVFVPDER